MFCDALVFNVRIYLSRFQLKPFQTVGWKPNSLFYEPYEVLKTKGGAAVPYEYSYIHHAQFVIAIISLTRNIFRICFLHATYPGSETLFLRHALQSGIPESIGCFSRRRNHNSQSSLIAFSRAGWGYITCGSAVRDDESNNIARNPRCELRHAK